MPLPDGYQVVKEVTNFRDVAKLMKEEGNWLFIGTGGWHGTSMTLDDCVRIMKGEDETWLPDGSYVTVFIVNPKAVSIRWGEIKLKAENEVEYLRNKVIETMESVTFSQIGNT